MKLLNKHSLRTKPVSVFLLATIALAGMTGCGPSQEELMMRAARRKRPSADGDKKKEVAAPQEAVPNVASDDPGSATLVSEEDNRCNSSKKAAKTPSLQQSGLASSTNSQNTPKATADEGEVAGRKSLSLEMISQRRPDEPLEEAARTERAVENIESLASAIQDYYAEKGRLPNAFSKSSSGIPTLSWRVRLLPYLGHQDLYDRFDFNTPWNLEPNKSLLEYIPDAFVSPERFDTSTNYLLPAGKKFLFGENRSPTKRSVEDGFGNTLMLFEVNDELSVPWSKPVDFGADSGEALKRGIGGLRPGATFAIWGNGLPVLITNSLSGDQLFRACTFEAGDGLSAGDIHQDLEVASVVSATTSPETTTKTTSPFRPNAPARTAGRPHPDASVNAPIAIQRAVVPTAVELADAQRKLREVYSADMRAAKERSAKDKLARKLLQDAQAISGDPAGAYALQNAGLRLAADSGLADSLIVGIDQRVGMFEVEPYAENVRWLLQLRRGTEERKRSNRNLMNRAVRVANTGIDQNDFSRAADVVALALRFFDRKNDEAISSMLSRLRTLLSSAHREFEVAVTHLDAYRKDRSDAESAAAFGRFLCFIKGDWQNGLPLLAEHGGDTLRPIAQADLESAFSPEDQTELGDQWWDLGEQAKPGVYQQAARDRAGHWYSIAYQSMPNSLDRIHVKNRLDRLAEKAGGSLVAVCRQLADELGVDLGMQLGDFGTLQTRANYDDDD